MSSKTAIILAQIAIIQVFIHGCFPVNFQNISPTEYKPKAAFVQFGNMQNVKSLYTSINFKPSSDVELS